jgi:GNAT superfamily N-acetyltransferase
MLTLPDGGEVLVRKATLNVVEGLRRMFSRCSRETIYLRFHLPLPSVLERVMRLLVGASEYGGEALAALDGEEVVGHVMYARDEEGDTEAEVAVVIEDRWQSGSLGTLLLSKIAEGARRAGVEALTGIALAKNHRILDLTRGVLPGRLCSFRGGTCVIHAPLAKPVADAECSGERGP